MFNHKKIIKSKFLILVAYQVKCYICCQVESKSLGTVIAKWVLHNHSQVRLARFFPRDWENWSQIRLAQLFQRETGMIVPKWTLTFYFYLLSLFMAQFFTNETQ